ncbi:serine/threonine-protein kinase [Actinocorallia sp. A-T 12471]|uniref:serine/threonine-protein kinase n=1 Tax=Actinocorallia sp. A-T 12471 TaxID=3089813 RepID=UPI0029D1FA1F|nr:serine/threonine-protein kinase [Actinocorallia sp. A-T 12471]MDX6742133.1 serine/threonine-protein kinase [Actinocorallia sp. A-T 12471]
MMRLEGRYTLGEVLGEGGMGRVWRAYDDVTRREVAVKEVFARVSAERALREAKAMARLRHPEIVRVHDVLMSGDRPWIVMEFLDGTTLDAVLADKGSLPPERVAELGRAVLRALAHAHDQGVVHRDVKPGNVFVRADGRIVLTDFGISSLDGEERLTATGYPIGTPGYVAPERLRHADRPPEPSADLFSLGALLYTALAGRAPFARDTPLASLTAPLTDRPERPDGPPRLVAAIMGMLAADPRGRAAAASRLTDPKITRPGSKMFRGVRALEAGLVVAVAVGVVVGLGLAARDGPEPPAPVFTQPAVVTPPPRLEPSLQIPQLFPTIDPEDLSSLLPTVTYAPPPVDLCDLSPDLC